MERVFGTRGTGWAMRALTANGQPTLGAYAPQPGVGHRAHTLQVLTVTAGRIARNVVCADPRVFDAFVLSHEIPPGEFRTER